ncbi:MAG: hypothetical protein M5U14_16600 [Acidimicrobiia bacterium]|nr:hypothetical protein [Acidimicrobiia bacterium]
MTGLPSRRRGCPGPVVGAERHATLLGERGEPVDLGDELFGGSGVVGRDEGGEELREVGTQPGR